MPTRPASNVQRRGVTTCGGEAIVRINWLSDDLVEQVHAGVGRLRGSERAAAVTAVEVAVSPRR